MGDNLLINKIKTIIDSKKEIINADILIKGTNNDLNIMIKNLFLESFNQDDRNLKGIVKIDIRKEINIFFDKKEMINTKVVAKINKDIDKYDLVIECISLLNKRINEESIKEITKSKKNSLIIFTNIECLDSREFNEIKLMIDNYLGDIKYLTVMSHKDFKCELNQWDGVVKEIACNIKEKKKSSFYKAQIIDLSAKRELASNIVSKYTNVLKELDEDVLDKESLIYIQDRMIDDILSVYSSYGEEVKENIKLIVIETIERLILIKEKKAKKILREKRRLEKIERERIEKLEYEKEQERKLAEKLKKIEEEKNRECDIVLEEVEVLENELKEIIIDADFIIEDDSEESVGSYNKNSIDLDARIEECISRVLDEKLENLLIQFKNQIKDEVIKSVFK